MTTNSKASSDADKATDEKSTAAKAATTTAAAAPADPSDAQLAAAAKTIANAADAADKRTAEPEHVAAAQPGAATPSSEAARMTDPAHGRLIGLSEAIERDASNALTDLQHRLETEEGMTISEKRKGSGVHVVKMAGITAEATGGIQIALENWAAAARRAVLADAPTISGRT